MMDRRFLVARYVLADLFGSALAWTLFYAYRKMLPGADQVRLRGSDWISIPTIYKGLVLVPLFWFGLYTMIGGYREIHRRYRIMELGQTF